MSRRITNLRVPIPCIKGVCGDRLDVFQAIIAPGDIISILGHDPRSKNWNSLSDSISRIYSYLQRKTSKTRKDSLTGYITDRILSDELPIGAFPALAIGMTHPADFVMSDSDASGSQAGMGTIHFDISNKTGRILLDGLGRVTAALDLLESGQEEVNEKVLFMVSFYAPSAGKGVLEVGELGQLFHDFNFLGEPVSKGQAVDLDQSNIYITLTNRLTGSNVIKKHGGVEPRAASLGKKSTALVAKQVLLKFVKAACAGDLQAVNVMRRSPQEGRLSVATLGEMESRIADFLQCIADEMGPAFHTQRDSVHLSASGWAALGMLFYDLHFNLNLPADEFEKFSRAVGRIDWSRSNKDWIGYLGGNDGDRLGKVFGGRAISRILDYVRYKIGLVPLLKAEDVTVREDMEEKLALTGASR